MKRTISTIVLLCLVWLGIKADGTLKADNDTLVRMNYPERVEIRTEGDSIFIKAKGFVPGEGYGTYTYTFATSESEEDNGDWEVNIPFTSSYRERKKIKSKRRNGLRLSIDWFDNLYVGGVTGAGDKPKGMRGGWEIGVDNLFGDRHRLAQLPLDQGAGV